METIRITADNKKVLDLLAKIKQRKQEVKAEMKNSPFVKKLKSAAKEGGNMNNPTNNIQFHSVNDEMPEDNQPVLWWYKGLGCPPYCGCVLDVGFPNIDFFFAWCEIPNPSVEFWETFNPTQEPDIDLRQENLKLHVQNHQIQEQLARRDEQIKGLLADIGELQDALTQELLKQGKQRQKGGKENEEGDRTAGNPPVQ